MRLKNLLVITAFILLVCPLGRGAVAPFRVAVLYPSETPGNKSIGSEMRCLSQAYLEELKKKAPFPFAYEFFDNERDPLKTAVRTTEIVQRGFDAIVGTTNSTEALAAKRALGTSEIPLITPTASHPDVTGEGGMIISIAAHDATQAKGLTQYITRQLKPKRLLIVKNMSTPYSIYLADRLAEELPAADPNLKVVTYSFLDGSDFTPGLLKEVDALDPEVLFIPLLAPDAAAIYVMLKTRKKPITLMGADAVGGRPEFLASLGKTAPHVTLRYTGQWDTKVHGKYAARFQKVLAKHCPGPVTMVSIVAFDALNVLFQTLAKNPRLRGRALVKAIVAEPYDGVLGFWKFGASQNADRALSVFEIVEGQKDWRGYLR